MERNRPTEAHSPTGDSSRRDLSEHVKKPTDRGTLTLWRRQREGLVRTRKENDRPRHTHFLETAEGGPCQDTERNRPTETYSPTGDSRGRNLSGHGKKPTDRGALTIWRRQRERLVKTRKETDQPRRTHFLETAEGGPCQDTERNRPTETCSPTGDSRGRDLSGHVKKTTDQGALTHWRRQREGLVRTWKETDRPRHTHFLETVEGGTCQDTEGNLPTEAHSQTGDGRGRDLLGHGKKLTDRDALTLWRRQREGLVSTWKETDRPRRTHTLETVEGGTC